jgi:hypothetical protein
MMRRRAPACAINFCCPYRNDLCVYECSGERIPKDDFLIVDSDFAHLRATRGGPVVRYSLPEETKLLLIDFDRGCLDRPHRTPDDSAESAGAALV